MMRLRRTGSLAALLTPLALVGALASGPVVSGAAAAEVEEPPATATLRTSKPSGVPGAAITLSGVVAPAGAGYAVTLQHQDATGWVPIRSAVTDAAGAWSLPLPTRWYSQHRFRAVVTNPDAADPAASVTSTPVTVRVVPGYSPQGLPGQHDYFSDANTRWNPCTPIGYKVRTTGGYAGSLKHIKKAFRLVGFATGLRFVYEGSTNVVPANFVGDPSTDITVAWAGPARVPQLGGSVVGFGGNSYRWVDVDNSEIMSGFVILDSSAKNQLVKGFSGKKSTWGGVMIHEIGHVMNLDHVGARSQIMFPAILAGPARLEAGDLRGLAKVGAARGCLPGAIRARSAAPGRHLDVPLTTVAQP